MSLLNWSVAGRSRGQLSLFGALLLLGTSVSGSAWAEAPSFDGKDLGASASLNMSADGTIVVYGVTSQWPYQNVYVWDETGTTQVELSNQESIGNYVVSRDGSVIGGHFGLGDGGAFLWSNGTTTLLTDLASESKPRYSSVGALSVDGSVAGGTSLGDDDLMHAVLWDAGGITDIGMIDNKNTYLSQLSGNGQVAIVEGSSKYAVYRNGALTTLTEMSQIGTKALSFDGSVIVGSLYDEGIFHAIRSVNGVGEDLGVLSGYDSSTADMVSQDGSVVVGQLYKATLDGIYRAFRWENGTMVDLGSLGGNTVEALGMSGDGKVIVGWARTSEALLSYSGFYWDEAGGLRLMTDMLTDAGLDVSGWDIQSVVQVSDDGSSMAGKLATAYNTSGIWWARCITKGSCSIIDDKTLATSLGSIGLVGETGNLFTDDTLQSTVDAIGNTGPNGSTFITGQVDTDPSGAAGIGVAARPLPDLSVGAQVSAGLIDTPLAYDGKAHFTATALTAAIAFAPADGFFAKGSVTTAWLKGDIDRGYLNGNDIVGSHGETSGTSWGASLTVGRKFADVAPGLSFSPYINVSHSSSSYDGWTETGGPMPASIAAFSTQTTLVRLGVEAERDFGDGTVVSAGAALVHRATDADAIAGSIPSLTALSVDGDSGASDWVELSVGARARVTDTVTGSIRLIGRIPREGDPSVYGNASLSVGF